MNVKSIDSAFLGDMAEFGIPQSDDNVSTTKILVDSKRIVIEKVDTIQQVVVSNSNSNTLKKSLAAVVLVKDSIINQNTVFFPLKEI